MYHEVGAKEHTQGVEDTHMARYSLSLHEAKRKLIAYEEANADLPQRERRLLARGFEEERHRSPGTGAGVWESIWAECAVPGMPLVERDRVR